MNQETELQLIKVISELSVELKSLKDGLSEFKESIRSEINTQRVKTHEVLNTVHSLEIRMASRTCQEHGEKIIEVEKSIKAHISDAEKDNGWHDRIRRLENITRYQWAYMLGCGILGGAIASGTMKIWVAVSKILGV